MGRGEASRNVPRSELNGNVPLSVGDHQSEPISITAYRRGDKILFGGRISKIATSVVTASVIGTLTVGELVRLYYSVKPLGQVERHARVQQQQGEMCEFRFLTL